MRQLQLQEECCHLCQEWAAAPPPAKGFCKVLERQTWGEQWCSSFMQAGGGDEKAGTE